MSLHHMLRAAAGYQAPAPANTDPQFNYVSLLLHGDGTNGAQNNTFVDSSANNFTITRNGNTTQGSLSPYGNLWSNFFDGTGDYLNTPSNAAFSFGTGDFTVELWAYCTQDLTNGTTQFSLYASEALNSSGSFGLFFLGGTWYVRINGLGNDLSVAASASQRNTWVHFAVCRNAGTMTFYINGAAVASGNRSTQSVTQTQAYLGVLNGFTGYDFAGYMSNVRVVKGTAAYTGAFTPPTAPLTAISGTSLLTCQSNRFIDNSANNFTITRNGDVRVTKEAPFLPTAAYSTSVIGGSGYFDGTGDWLRIDNNTAFDLSTGSWTIEAWIYVTGGTYYRTIISKRATSPSANCDFEFGVSNTNTLYFYRSGAGAFNGSATVPTNTWVHAAITYDGTTFRMFQNGVLVFSQAGLTATYNAYPIGIGNWDGPGIQDFLGYISNLRVVKGTAAYTAAFTPPTSPVTAISGTSLLLNFTNAGIFDNAAENDLETVGNAQISTSVKKYGTGSLAFDGTGDWLLVPDNTNLQLGSGSFTVEGWVNLALLGSARGLVSKGTSTTGWSLSVNSLNQVVFTDATTAITTTTALMANTWYHVAVVRSGTGTNQTVIYIDGVSSATGTSASNFNQTSVMYVGADRTGGSALNGYLDDLRITKGYARYTSTFTPPTAAFPDQ